MNRFTARDRSENRRTLFRNRERALHVTRPSRRAEEALAGWKVEIADALLSVLVRTRTNVGRSIPIKIEKYRGRVRLPSFLFQRLWGRVGLRFTIWDARSLDGSATSGGITGSEMTRALSPYTTKVWLDSGFAKCSDAVGRMGMMAAWCSAS